MKLAPRQMAIVAAMEAVRNAYNDPAMAAGKKLGVAQERGMKKELAKIHNRLGKRLPENVERTELPVDSGE